jgi:LysW-gamma-L-lysine carboxypeptidase
VSDLNASATLLGLVTLYSPSGEEARASAWLAGRMRDLGYTSAFIDPVGNVVGIHGDGPRQIVLIGHIDTVRGEIPVRVEGDVLYGRGSVDAKGPLACFVDAAARVGERPGWQIVVLGAVEEERESEGARYAAGLYHPEYAIIGEPSRWNRITLGYKGSAWAAIRARRSLAHTAGQSESACEATAAAWERIRVWSQIFNTGRERAFDQILPTLRGMSSGDDGFQEWAEVRVGVRLPPDLPPQAWYEKLDELCQPGGHGLSVERLGYAIPAYQAQKNTPLVRAFLSAIRSAGEQPGFVLKTGTSDLNIVAPVWSCAAAVYGPGDSTLDHTPHEHISLEEYHKAVGVLAAVLDQLTADC